MAKARRLRAAVSNMLSLQKDEGKKKNKNKKKEATMKEDKEWPVLGFGSFNFKIIGLDLYLLV